MPEIHEPERKRRIIPKHGTPTSNAKHVVVIAVEVLRRSALDIRLDDLKDVVKTECARFHLAYDADVVGRAVEVALGRRARGAL